MVGKHITSQVPLALRSYGGKMTFQRPDVSCVDVIFHIMYISLPLAAT